MILLGCTDYKQVVIQQWKSSSILEMSTVSLNI